MNLSMLLALLATSATVFVWGSLFGMIAEDRMTRARGWAVAACGFAFGVAACGEWHGSPAGRMISALVIVMGSLPLLSSRPSRDEAAPDSADLMTDRSPP